jgi:hypothetical protein
MDPIPQGIEIPLLPSAPYQLESHRFHLPLYYQCKLEEMILVFSCNPRSVLITAQIQYAH